MDALTSAVLDAARRGLRVIGRAHVGEHLVGYALCTDDDVMSLYQVGCTREYLARQGDPDLRYLAVEWPYDEDGGVFDDVRRTLRAGAAAAQGPAFRAHVDRSFGCLVDAMHRLRAEGAVAADVLLVVASTDPGEHLAGLETRAVRNLNPDGPVDRYLQANGL